MLVGEDRRAPHPGDDNRNVARGLHDGEADRRSSVATRRRRHARTLVLRELFNEQLIDCAVRRRGPPARAALSLFACGLVGARMTFASLFGSVFFGLVEALWLDPDSSLGHAALVGCRFGMVLSALELVRHLATRSKTRRT